jgi:tetratricopeptide (TPR) repeat protein
VYFRQGKYKEAEELYVQSLKVRQAALGDSHPDVARYQSYQSIGFERPHVHTLWGNRGLHDLAELYQKLGRYEEAEPLHQKYVALGLDRRRAPSQF